MDNNHSNAIVTSCEYVTVEDAYAFPKIRINAELTLDKHLPVVCVSNDIIRDALARGVSEAVLLDGRTKAERKGGEQ